MLRATHGIVASRRRIPDDYLIWYTMDNISGSTLTDEAANYNGTISGASAVTGYIGNGLDFDGVNDYVTVSGYTPPSTFSASFWIETTDLSGDNMCALGTDSAAASGRMYLYANTSYGSATNQIRLYAGEGEVFVGSDIRNTGWRHMMLIRNGTSWSLYLDGSLDASGTKTATPDSNLLIGNSQDDYARPLNGIIDQFRFYTRVLSSDEITALANES